MRDLDSASHGASLTEIRSSGSAELGQACPCGGPSDERAERPGLWRGHRDAA